MDLRRAAFDAADVALAVLDRDGRVADANAAFLALAGRARDAVVGRTPEFLDLGAGERTLLTRPDGSRLPVRCVRRPIVGGGTALTVTELVPGSHYPEVVESIEQGICIQAADGRIVEVNAAAERIMGLPRTVTRGKTSDDLAPRCIRPDGTPFPGDEHPAMVTLRTGRPVTGQMMGLCHADGQVRWIRIDTRPILHPQAGPSVLAAFVDVTELMATQGQLEKSEHKFRAIFENAFEFIGLLSPDGRLLEANRTALGFLGRDRLGELAGIHFADSPWFEHSPEDRARLREAIHRCAAGEFVRFETTHVDLDGGIAYIDFSLRPMRGDDGRVTFLIPEGRDITQRKHAEAAMLSAKLEAEAANRVKSEFLATVSHELRTPLNAVIGFSEAILSEAFGPVDATRCAEYLRLIHSAGVHLRSVIEDILDVSRIEMGRIDLDEEETDPAQLIEGVVRLAAGKAQSRNISLGLDLPAGLPRILADQRRLRQVVLNLLSNALKFTPEGGAVTVAARTSADGFEVVVADTGPGIPPEHLPKVWQPFYQVDASLSRKHGGSGLGLAIVKHYVEAHGGRITLDSAPARGTRARVVLPPARLLRQLASQRA